MKTKVCSKCHKRKNIVEFYKSKQSKDSYKCWCKNCYKKYAETNREKITQYQKQYRNNNKQKIKQYQKEYDKKYYKKNKKAILERQGKYYLKNEEKCKKRNKKWYNEHKNKLKEYRKSHRRQSNIWQKKKLLTDIGFKLGKNLRKRIWKALKGINKAKKTIELLGCTILEFKLHLQNQFKKGMTWNNYGYYGWHVDHIKSCKSFDLSKVDEQRKCFHYTNLQPLWRKENQSKK